MASAARKERERRVARASLSGLPVRLPSRRRVTIFWDGMYASRLQQITLYSPVGRFASSRIGRNDGERERITQRRGVNRGAEKREEGKGKSRSLDFARDDNFGVRERVAVMLARKQEVLMAGGVYSRLTALLRERNNDEDASASASAGGCGGVRGDFLVGGGSGHWGGGFAASGRGKV